MLLRDTDSLLVFVKLAGKEGLTRVERNKFPYNDDIEVTYNVLRINGKILMIVLSPYSESGDWNLEFRHYFDAAGHTFVFEKDANMFGLPNDGVGYETTTDYFASGLKKIGHSYALSDKDGKKLGKEYAFDRDEEFKTKIYPGVETCLRAYNIQLTAN
jgi:hypothetical protein